MSRPRFTRQMENDALRLHSVARDIMNAVGHGVTLTSGHPLYARLKAAENDFFRLQRMHYADWRPSIAEIRAYPCKCGNMPWINRLSWGQSWVAQCLVCRVQSKRGRTEQQALRHWNKANPMKRLLAKRQPKGNQP